MTHLGFPPIAASRWPLVLSQVNLYEFGPDEVCDAPARDAAPQAPRAGAASPLQVALRAAGYSDHDIARLLELVVEVGDVAEGVLRAIGWAHETLAQVHGIEVAA